MDRFFKVIGTIESLITDIALAMLVGAVLWGSVTRYVTEEPAVWTTELSGILFTWIVFIGAATAFRGDSHIRITLFLDRLPNSIANPLTLFSKIAAAAFLIFVTFLSYKMMMKGLTRMSPVMNISFFWVYLASFVAFALMSLSSVLKLLRFIPESKSENASEVL